MEVTDHSIARVFDPSEPLSHISKLYDTHQYVHKMAMLRIEPMWRKEKKKTILKKKENQCENEDIYDDDYNDVVDVNEHSEQDRVCFKGPRIFGDISRFARYGSGQSVLSIQPETTQSTQQQKYFNKTIFYDMHGNFNEKNKRIQQREIKKYMEILDKEMPGKLSKTWRSSTSMSFVFNIVHYSVIHQKTHSDPFLMRVTSEDTTLDILQRASKSMGADENIILCNPSVHSCSGNKWHSISGESVSTFKKNKWSYANGIYEESSMPTYNNWRLVLLKCGKRKKEKDCFVHKEIKNNCNTGLTRSDKWCRREIKNKVLYQVLKFVGSGKIKQKRDSKDTARSMFASDYDLWVQDGIHHRFTLGLVYDRKTDLNFKHQWSGGDYLPDTILPEVETLDRLKKQLNLNTIKENLSIQEAVSILSEESEYRVMEAL